MSETFSDEVVARIKRLAQGPIKVACQREPGGKVRPPRSLTISLSFTVPELRALGIDVMVFDADGQPMTDDDYAKLLLETDGKPA